MKTSGVIWLVVLFAVTCIIYFFLPSDRAHRPEDKLIKVGQIRASTDVSRKLPSVIGQPQILVVERGIGISPNAEMTADKASAMLFADGVKDSAAIKSVWEWLKSHPNSPDYDRILNELMMTVPVEICTEIFAKFPSMPMARQKAVLHSMAAMLSLTSKPQEGDDLKFLADRRKELTSFLESEAYKGRKQSADAFESLLSKPEEKARVDDEAKKRAFDKFTTLPVQQLALLYPTDETGIDPKLFWSRKVAEYAFAVGAKQVDAISTAINLLPRLEPTSQEVIADTLLSMLRNDEMLMSAQNGGQGNESGDVILSPESIILLNEHRAWLNKIISR